MIVNPLKGVSKGKPLKATREKQDTEHKEEYKSSIAGFLSETMEEWKPAVGKMISIKV